MHWLKRAKFLFRRNRKILAVINTCGISGRDVQNCDQYIKLIRAALAQKFNGFQVVVSGCRNAEAVKNRLKTEFEDSISYVFTDDWLTVNCTFNNAIQKIVQKLGMFDGYIYIDSGVELDSDQLVFQKLYDIYKSGPYAMVMAQSQSDNNYRPFLKEDHLPEGPEPYEVPLGFAPNMHLQLFSNEIFDKFNGILILDVFWRYATESTFVFVCSSIKRKMAICRNTWLGHICNLDLASSGFPQKDSSHWNDAVGHRSISTRIMTPQAKECGFGFEEQFKVLMHDQTKFDKNEYAIDNKLYLWLKENLCLNKSELDYSKINTKVIL